MNRFVFPLLLGVMLIVLFSLQCTVTYRWVVWGVHLELLPPLLFYASFTVNSPTSTLLGLLVGLLYDSFSGGPFGASVIPYVGTVSLFCMLRPIFFRNRLTTQFLSGILFGWLVLAGQWALSGKVLASWNHAFTLLLRLALFCGILSILYFAALDFISRALGQEPGRFD